MHRREGLDGKQKVQLHSMASGLSYSRTLRVVGQSLEELGFSDFDLRGTADGYVVNCADRDKSLRSGRSKFFQWIWKAKSGRAGDIPYTGEEILRLDLQGLGKRRIADQIPDYYCLSQTLRTVGEYIDHTSFRLLSLRRRGARLVLELEQPEGRKRVEEHAIASFHNYFLQMYMHRNKKTFTPI